jgi:hypothetical protein
MRYLNVILMSVFMTLSFIQTGCQTMGGGTVAGNEKGSQPLNDGEVNAYKRAILKCYKTGGTRVVKINGDLRCFN